ncbi:MAG: response regulator [Pseudobdellovibrio sp.]
MKNVLVVDDEVEIVNTLKEYLSEKGFNVLTCHGADQAFDYYKNNQADLILSDIKMPGKSGLDLFKQCSHIPDHSHVPFILMTAYSDIIGVESAFALGVSELIAKPFDLDSLNLVINYLLQLEGSVGSSNEKYFQVPIEEFMRARTNDYDIYLQVVDKFVLVTKSGQEFSEQRISNFAKKGITHIFLTSQDFVKFTDLQFSLDNSLSNRPFDIVRKNKVMDHLMITVNQSQLSRQIDRNSLTGYTTIFESYTNIALNNVQVITMLNHLLMSAPDIVEKSALRSLLSAMVAGQWKWNSSKIQSRLILSGLMCDVSLKDHPQLLNKRFEEYSVNEKSTYERHPLESYRMLSQIPNIPEEIPLVALQHHESSAGTGFPQRLNRSKLHSYSVVVYCVNEFIEILYASPDPSDVEGALERLSAAKGKLVNEQVIKTLYKIFNLKVPKKLEDVLLPHETSRLN